MGALDASLGAILIGTWIDCMLYMLELTQIYTFFTRYPKDHPLLKATIWVLLLVDTVGSAAGNGTAYLYTITYWGDAEAITKQYWTFPTYCTATACSAAIVQSFLIFRFWNLSKTHLLAVVLVCMSLSALVGGVWTAVAVSIFSDLAQRPRIVTPVTLWFAATAATDISITLCLVWQLRRVKNKTVFKATQSMLSRLTGMAIQTGSVTSVFAIVILGFFLKNPSGSIAVGVNECFGRVYTLTMLYNLNNRRSIRNGVSSKSGTSGPDLEAGNSAAIDLSQIRVEHQTHTVQDYSLPVKTRDYATERTQSDDGSLTDTKGPTAL
ncbi:hypothetical protein PUNSTDRAFT_126411 [Punctularia strigosozonata HHB-11173 SS5]|uniref:uncharacterized protein n=1 Tax=Punctularia strigosozonata (strain HHB-11173) TaxID=741275 RepID=UPI0004417555|nr:uncharacterized protein PUNSTDRAFT_126411 [Punctularia strigosozonata HHB-11173 SS5]EIN08325.1 hypothetical protein PUNSTDRAFT_126411 [Punctularia strigosozonata HHB-11173 SS5]